MTMKYSVGAEPSQRLAREFRRAKNHSVAFARTAKILQMAADTDLSGLDMLGDAIGAERLHRILSHGANQRDLKLMRDFVRLRRDNRVRHTSPKAETAGEARLRELEWRRGRKEPAQ